MSTDGPALSSQYNGGSDAGGQGNGTGGILSNADLWNLYWSGSGAGSSSSGSDEGSLADDPTISAQYTGGSGIGSITPLVSNPESDGPPVFHSGVWTGDDGSVQFVQTADTGNQGTGEGDTSQSDGKSRARSWWGIRGWFLGDDPIDDGGAKVVQVADTASDSANVPRWSRYRTEREQITSTVREEPWTAPRRNDIEWMDAAGNRWLTNQAIQYETSISRTMAVRTSPAI